MWNANSPTEKIVVAETENIFRNALSSATDCGAITKLARSEARRLKVKSPERVFFIPSLGHRRFFCRVGRSETFQGHDLEPISSHRALELPFQLRQTRRFFLYEHSARIFHDRHLHLSAEFLPSPRHQQMAVNHPSLALI